MFGTDTQTHTHTHKILHVNGDRARMDQKLTSFRWPRRPSRDAITSTLKRRRSGPRGRETRREKFWIDRQTLLVVSHAGTNGRSYILERACVRVCRQQELFIAGPFVRRLEQYATHVGLSVSAPSISRPPLASSLRRCRPFCTERLYHVLCARRSTFTEDNRQPAKRKRNELNYFHFRSRRGLLSLACCAPIHRSQRKARFRVERSRGSPELRKIVSLHAAVNLSLGKIARVAVGVATPTMFFAPSVW